MDESRTSPNCDGITEFKSSIKKVTFCWVPCHIGIGGNEKADLAAKDALNLLHANFCSSIQTLATTLINTAFPTGRMNGMMREQTGCTL